MNNESKIKRQKEINRQMVIKQTLEVYKHIQVALEESHQPSSSQEPCKR